MCSFRVRLMGEAPFTIERTPVASRFEIETETGMLL